MKTNDNHKLLNETKESSLFFKKIKEYDKAKKDLIRTNKNNSKNSSKMTEQERFEIIIHGFNERTIVHNKLTEVISIGFKLFSQEEACHLLGINKSQYKKMLSPPMLPIIRTGKNFNEDFANYEKIQKSAFQNYSRINTKTKMEAKMKLKKESQS